jgi:hypothetical protein
VQTDHDRDGDRTVGCGFARPRSSSWKVSAQGGRGHDQERDQDGHGSDAAYPPPRLHPADATRRSRQERC